MTERTKHSKVEGLRPSARGKFIFRGNRKQYITGATYGTFAVGQDRSGYPPFERVRADFAQMAENRINTVRTYTVPPHWLLDLALENGIQVMVGLPWEQHVAFLDDSSLASAIRHRLSRGVASCARHPAVLCYLIGNEISAPMVRWHGRRRVERFLRGLYETAKDKDPDGLVSYVSFPSTEYLELPFLDLVCFNVFLEQQQSLDRYLARLQNIAGDRPLILTEVGLDSQRNGEGGQAASLAWQIRTVFRAGAAGCVVFAWTDEWNRNGHEVNDWSFGLTDRRRLPKPALAAARDAFADAPVLCTSSPSVSVIVCTHNGAASLGDCLEGLLELDYPNYEVIIVDDGSTDGTSELTERFAVRTISTEHLGLSAARNAGLAAATGEIVAYLDDDCFPDPHWLRYLVTVFADGDFVGAGGPNIPPPHQGVVAECVAFAPGAPTHVLVSDQVAEHVPGCNMAFRRDALEAIGGFDPQFRIAGDDVDICWALQQAGGKIGFHPSAVVWHRRRATLRGYLRQQREYGKAEALLERKWPERYNVLGHTRWTGRMYSPRSARSRSRRSIRYGPAGNGLFQSAVDSPHNSAFGSLPLTPEWYLLCIVLAVASVLEAGIRPMWGHLPGTRITLIQAIFGLAAAVPISLALRNGWHAFSDNHSLSRARVLLRLLTALMYLLQPSARLIGRLQRGLTPWRRRQVRGLALPRRQLLTTWSEQWAAPEETLTTIQNALRASGSGAVRRGSEYDRWDLELRTGTLGSSRLRLVTEEHGEGRRLLRFLIWPRIPAAGPPLLLAVAVLAPAAMFRHQPVSALVLTATGLALLWRMVLDCSRAMHGFRAAVESGSVGLPLRDLARSAAKSSSGAQPDLVRAGGAQPLVHRGARVGRPAQTLALSRPEPLWAERRLSLSPVSELREVSQLVEEPTDVPADVQITEAARKRRLLKLSPKGAWETWKLLPRVLPYVRPYKRLAVTSALLMVIAAVMGLAYPWPLAFMVDSVLGHHHAPTIITSVFGSGRYSLLIFAAASGLALTVLGNVATVIQEYTNTKLNQRLVLDFRSDLFEHAQRLSVTFHDETKTGQLMSQVNYESEAAGSLIMAILPLVQSALTLGGMFYVAYRIDPVLALLALTVVPFVYYSVGFYSAKIVPRLQFVRGLEWETFSIIYEALNMLRVVVAFGREGHEYRRFRRQGETAVAARVNLTVRQTVFSLVVNTLTAAGTALVLGFGAAHVIHHQLSVGDLLVVIAYIAAVYKPLEEISSTLGGLQQQLVMIQGAFMLLDTSPEIKDSPGAVDVGRTKGEIEFQDVSFTYRSRPETLKHISFRAPAGSCIAVVGPTGAGKTTLISLLKRFYDPDHGRILLDGTPLKKITLSSLRDQISVVLQTPQLFSGTIKDNIRYGRLEASDEDVIAAARAANADEFISALPAGYDTELGEDGAQLSGGERQRICVARAFLKDAPILILDEPTSSIDSKTEAVILDALDELMVGRTTLMIAHRLSTVRHADKIVVLNQGEIVQEGVHDQLLAQGGLYKELYDTQHQARRRLRLVPGDEPAADESPSPEPTEELPSVQNLEVRAAVNGRGDPHTDGSVGADRPNDPGANGVRPSAANEAHHAPAGNGHPREPAKVSLTADGSPTPHNPGTDP